MLRGKFTGLKEGKKLRLEQKSMKSKTKTTEKVNAIKSWLFEIIHKIENRRVEKVNTIKSWFFETIKLINL